VSIDNRSFVKAVRKIAADDPAHIYEPPEVHEGGNECVYVEKNDKGVLVGSCLIGRALVALGVHPKDLPPQDGFQNIASVVLDDLKLDLSLPVREWADGVQGEQDAGNPFGTAVRIADEKVPEIKRFG
jgi:hypothetical protein